MKVPSRLEPLRRFAAALVLALASEPLLAQTCTYTGPADNWSNPARWSPSVPGPSNTAEVNPSSAMALVNLDVSPTIRTLITGAFNGKQVARFGGTGTLTVGNGLTTIYGQNAMQLDPNADPIVFDCPVTVVHGSLFSNYANRNIVFNGPLHLAGAEAWFQMNGGSGNPANYVVNGDLTGSGSLRIDSRLFRVAHLASTNAAFTGALELYNSSGSNAEKCTNILHVASIASTGNNSIAFR